MRAKFKAKKMRRARPPDRYITVELRHESRITYSEAEGRFEGPDEEVYRPLNEVLEDFDLKRFRSRFRMKPKEIAKRAQEKEAPGGNTEEVSADFAQSGFVEIVPYDPKDLKAMADRFNQLADKSEVAGQGKVVWEAQVGPIISEPMLMPPDLKGAQGYLEGAPKGIGASLIRGKLGGSGKDVTIVDIELNWDLNHAELSPGVQNIGGALPLGGEDHGTAVLGILVGSADGKGIVGICPEADVKVHSRVGNNVENVDLAIKNAITQDHVKRGDIILLEVQGRAPEQGIDRNVAIQYWASELSAMREAIDKGIIVIEAAGNGNVNFGDTRFQDTYLQKDIGAFVVGAGAVPWFFTRFLSGGSGVDGDTARRRQPFSNYGAIVNVQAWGENVTTIGFGHANELSSFGKYTYTFFGTSSAAAIVAGAVACMQAHANAVLHRPLTASEILKIIDETGAEQQATPGSPLTQKIGRQPDLVKAFQRIQAMKDDGGP